MIFDKIRKRDGSIVNFDSNKISFAITRAGTASNEFNHDIANELTQKVLSLLEPNPIQDIEKIQDIVEKMLWEAGFLRTARAYIVYREQHARLRFDHKIQINVISSIDEYLNRADWRVNANANQGYSLGGLILNSAGKMIANYWLSHVYPPEIGNAHREADFHIHDLDFLAGYCSGWSLRMLLQEGLNGVPGKIEAAPPKHMSSAIGQIVNFLGTLQNEWAGAQAFSSFDTYMAPYVRLDKLDYSQVKQNIQELIYNLNVPSRWGNQTPFTNLTFDWVCPEDLKPQIPIIGSKEIDFTYGDLQYEMDLINKAYIEVMTEGDSKGRIFTFPIPTYNITNDFPWDSENADLLFNMTAKFGLPYFQNFINSDLKPNMVRSMCLFPEEKILFKAHEQISNTTIGNLFAEYANRQLDSEWWECIPNVSALSLNPNTGKFEWAKITKFLRITDNRLVSIKTKDGKLMRVSANHLVAVLTPQGIETKRADEVTIGDFVLVVKDASAILNQNIILEEDIKLAWFIGLFIADGNYLYDNRYELQRLRGVQISFNLQDIELINACRDFVKQRLNYEMKFVKDKRYKNSLYGYIYNTQFANFLFIEKGVRKYGGIPNWLWNSNIEVIKSFLSGFFDGDGYKSGQEIHINDAALAIELNLLLQIVGISTTYIAKKHSQVVRIQHTLGRNSKGTKIKCDKLHNSIPQFLLDKFDVTNAEGVRYHCYGKKMVGLSAIDRWGLTNDKIEWLRHSDFAVVAVRSVHIENLDYQQEFYDVELEKNHYFVHSDGNISHNCCRLQLDLRELLKRGNGLFGSAEQTGSIGVVTINCARLGYLFKSNITGLYERLDYLLELAKNSLEIKRKVIQRHIDLGLFPYTKRYLGTLRNHFSTIGVNGINEMIRNFTNDNEDITTTNGHEIAARLLDHIRAKMIAFQESTGHMYNLEATPAEGTTYRFAKEDQKRFNEILQAGTKEAPYYTNSSQLPVGYTTDAFQALEMQENLQAKYTGGCVEKGTKVITDKGSFNIEEIVDNFKSLSPIHALSYNLNIEQSEWDLITDAISVVVSQNDKIRVVAEKGLNIVTSDWHPFFVLQKKPFAGICLTCGTKLASVKGLPSHFRTHQECKFAYQDRQPYEVIEKRADQLLVGDYILQNATNMFAEKIGIDDDLAYLIGFFISNGSISKTIDDRGGNALERFIVRFFSEHQSVLDKVANILNKHFDCCVSIKQGDKRSNKLFIVSTNKKSVCDFLFDYGFHSGVKAYTVHIPIKLQQCLFQSSFYALLSGLIDGDGHISKRYGDIEYSTVSKQLAADIVMLCTMAGIAVGMYEHPTYRPNEVTGYRVLFPASVVTRMKDRLSIQNDKNYIKDNLSNRKKRLLPVVRVLSTDKISVEDNLFYDLTTKKNHNYLAGNNSFVFIHNTVLHLYMGERISNSEACKKLIKRALERFRVPYLTISPTFSICPIHGYIDGEHKFCPLCDETNLIEEFIDNAC